MMNPRYQDLTAILVHAAWADGSSWNKVAVELQELGFQVRSAQIPLTGLSEDVAALKGLRRQVDGPMLLAGHSYAGAVITAAATDHPPVKALIYIAAIVPDEGETVGALFKPHGGVRPQITPDADGFLWLPPGAFANAVAPDASRAEYIAREVRRLRVTRLGEPSDVAEVVAFLCSEESRWMQGAIVDVDGGQNKGV